MQIQSTGQTQALAQSTPAQVRKMDGSGNGQGLRDGSNCTTPTSVQQSSTLPSNSTFSTYA